jgi:adenylate kinase
VTAAAVASLDERFELLNAGDVMLEEALGSGLDVTSRDDLSALSPGKLRRLQRRMGEYVAAIASDPDTHVVLNTHLVVNTAAGFVAGLPPEVLDDLDPAAFVLVEASPETIQERRSESGYRSYRGSDRLGIEFQQSMSRTAAFAYSTTVGSPVALVGNTDDIESAAVQLAHEIQRAASR